MLRKLLRKNDDEGFTLIELLVVILIIGILAAIALPSFLGQSDKAKDASAKSDARNAITQVESCLVDEGQVNNGAACTDSPQVKLGPSVPPPVITDSDNYVVVATSKTGTKFTIQKTAGDYTRSCDKPKVGACPSTGSW